MPACRISWLLVLAGILSACAAPQSERILANPGSLPSRVELGEVPFYPQDRNYCGPAALATVLSWSGEAITQDAAADAVFTPGQDGTLRSDMIAGARRHGRYAVPVATVRDLLAELAAGHPVVVFQNLSLAAWPQWHYAVAVGYDLPARRIVLRSGTTKRKVMDMAAFENTWSRGDHWAMVVLPPGRLAATATERESVRAAAGLERTGQYAAAVAAYEAIAERWPRSFAARMGLGNALYGLKRYGGAADAFRRASTLDRAAPEPWNNLAHALATLGRRDAAIDAAEKAIRLAPDDEKGRYRATLDDIATESAANESGF